MDWLRKERISILHTVPTLARAWLAGQNCSGLEALRLTFFAGEPLTDDLVHRWRAAVGDGCQIVNLYGPTETTMVKSYYLVPPDVLPGVQPVGMPQPCTQLLVLSGLTRLCAIGEIGQVAIRTPFRTLGYFNNPEENKKRFVPNPFREDIQDLVYLTGDRGRYRLDGSLELFGRVDDQVKVRGIRIEPAEVAAVLARHPSVESCFVGAWESEPGQTELVGYVVPVASGRAVGGELSSFLSAHLPAAMLPSDYVFLESMPRTPNGKVNRSALPAPVRTRQGEGEQRVPIGPRDRTEADLVRIWERVLETRPIGVTASFFDLGGHSLLAMRLFAEIEKFFSRPFPLSTLFEAPTIEPPRADPAR